MKIRNSELHKLADLGKGKNRMVGISAKIGGKSALTRTINSVITASHTVVNGFLFVKRCWKKTKTHSHQMPKRGIPY